MTRYKIDKQLILLMLSIEKIKVSLFSALSTFMKDVKFSFVSFDSTFNYEYC